MKQLAMNHFSWLILFLTYITLFFLEKRFPLRHNRAAVIQRSITNIVMTAVVILVVSFTVLPTVKFTMNLSQNHGIGLLFLTRLHGLPLFIAGFLLLDLSFYYWHRFNHKTPWLWRFHNVHHIDEDLDVTTSMRFHWGEIAYSSFFRFAQLIILGVTPFTLLIYEFCFQIATFFHHSNIKLPKKLEHILNYLIVSPRIHGIHHSNYREETDSNYGVIFTFWDRLHQTFNNQVDSKHIVIGVAAYDRPEDNQLKSLLTLPFKSQRDYWLKKEKHPHVKRERS